MNDLLDENEREYQPLAPLNTAVKKWGWHLSFLVPILALIAIGAVGSLFVWFIWYTPERIESIDWAMIFMSLAVAVFAFRLMRQHHQTSKNVSEYIESELNHDFELLIRSGFNGWYWWFLLLLTVSILATITLGTEAYELYTNNIKAATENTNLIREELIEENNLPEAAASERIEPDAVEESSAED